MLRITGETKAKPEIVIPLAVKFFSKQRGLKLSTQSPDGAQFSGRGGGITVRASTTGEKTEVEVMAIDWEQAVKDFLALVKKKK